MSDQESLEVACLRIASNTLAPVVETPSQFYIRLAKHAADLHLQYSKFLKVNEKVLREKI
jgi:hypothetical protein